MEKFLNTSKTFLCKMSNWLPTQTNLLFNQRCMLDKIMVIIWTIVVVQAIVYWFTETPLYFWILCFLIICPIAEIARSVLRIFDDIEDEKWKSKKSNAD